MESAVRFVLNNEMSFMRAARAHHVPVTTVKRLVIRVREEVSSIILLDTILPSFKVIDAVLYFEQEPATK